ncbi:hypothetical protein, conserved [Trypanosoma cruzi]|uniref:Uncharacterized protein n=2 Tax=Trypanosoma cruzi TaxID=5693 RepID=Q4DW96_TRYCC|nr:hypothetical protein, conserved [Trypanosoma cruzi]EAN96794.1 hypothetical protein, conserved [Trypanosoma cruzi]|eukprot:XP_818645.1 hypothetical protein [Trypanosoma cruzi strain CL Brener]
MRRAITKRKVFLILIDDIYIIDTMPFLARSASLVVFGPKAFLPFSLPLSLYFCACVRYHYFLRRFLFCFCGSLLVSHRVLCRGKKMDPLEVSQPRPPPPEEQQLISFLLHAPVHHATFFSLTLVEELLRHARRVDQEVSFLSLPLPRSRESTRVLSRIVQENRYEEYWPNEHPALDEARQSAPSASYLLRIGVLRALGFNTTGVDDFVDDVSLALGRRIVSAAPLPEDTASVPLRYREAAQEELRHVALGEWCEDLIHFTAYRGFSAEQVRCVLLTAMHLMNVVADLSPDATDVEAEKRCTQLLEELLIEQACGLPRKVVETHKSWRTVTSEIPDPEFVAEMETAISQEKNKKRRAALKEKLENAPRINYTRQELQKERFLTEIVVGPYFTLQEVAQILDYFSSSVVRHWRLFRAFLAEPQPVETHDEVQVQWDIHSFCVPPLEEFVRDDMYEIEQERRDLMSACEDAIESAFEEEFIQPLLALQREKDELLECLKERERQAEEDNIRNALDGPGYMQVTRGFILRLNKCIERNERVGKLELNEKPPDSTPPSPEPFSSQMSPSLSLANKSRRSVTTRQGLGLAGVAGNHKLAAAAPPSSHSENPADAVFSLEEVEARLEKLENAMRETRWSSHDRGRKKQAGG